MKILLTMFEHSSGISGKTGNPYSMASVQAHLPASSFKKEGYSRECLGYEPVQVEVGEVVIPKLKQMTFPCIAEVDTEVKTVRNAGKVLPVMVIVSVTNWAGLVPQPQKATA
ncbi:hypothetical protein [Chromobacterium violaceum]|uniref:hypothetical protein n=1 Tax=Chromobacterium violaceum TaxID=536 RepID=UPI00194F2BF6|nr:hypothetical protein [Chromobacterium violaceum]QRO33891.1 hypothetical protein I6K04_03885 [Chromobacterium violaceum]QRQ16305.1 hypothetical protein I6K03_18845 [Chromobacterium violaceum]